MNQHRVKKTKKSEQRGTTEKGKKNRKQEQARKTRLLNKSGIILLKTKESNGEQTIK